MVYAINIKDNFEPAKNFSSIGNILNVIFPTVSLGAAIICLVMLLYGGFTYISAGDNPKNIQKAWQTIIFAIIGLFIVALSYAAVRLITTLLKVELPY